MTTVDRPSIMGSGDAEDLPRYADYVRADKGVPVPAYLLEQAPISLDNLTIDSARYISIEFLELEAQRLWPKVWQQACRENDIPNVGDYFEYTIMDTSVLIVRSDPSTIRSLPQRLPASRDRPGDGIGQRGVLQLSVPRMDLPARRLAAACPSRLGVRARR